MNELYSEHPVMFKNNPLGFILALLLVPVLGIGLIIFLVWNLQNKASKLVVTENDVLFERGLLSKTRSEINISGIRTVTIKQTFLNRIFGTGTIELFTSGDHPEIVAVGMPDPNSVRDIIKRRQSLGN